MKREDREREIAERFPHFKSYKACQYNAFAYGSATLAGVSAGSYFVYDYAFKKFKLPVVSKNWLLALPFLTGTVAAYVVSMHKALICQRMWMAMEERHSVLTPAEERLDERINKTSKLKEIGS